MSSHKAPHNPVPLFVSHPPSSFSLSFSLPSRLFSSFSKTYPAPVEKCVSHGPSGPYSPSPVRRSRHLTAHDLVEYNINMNQNAQSPLEYTTSRSNTTYTPSPTNWRAIPFYTVLMDKFADGDPSNNDYFGTTFEYDWRETQLRAGGDLKGLVSKLDYLQGMGIQGIFVSGTPFINMLWQADSGCFLHLFGYLLSQTFPKVIPLSISLYWTHTTEHCKSGRMPSTRSMLVACTLWPTSLLAPWVI
jgi:hypothetical protein